MERKEIINQLNGIFADVLDLDEVNLTGATTADDIEEWDSLSHIQLIVAVEDAFDIKFSSLEIMKWANVGQMVDSIERLTSQA
ncbi:MAG: acyl carrier protein [Bacteroidaceae bacterium]|nr:acyl carrier protein [Bacteroidaceae bacterium]